MKPLSSFTAVGVLFLALVPIGCRTPSVPRVDTPEKKALQTNYLNLDLTASAGFPIVDVHTHTFNSRFLPIRNIVKARTDVLHAILVPVAEQLVCATDAPMPVPAHALTTLGVTPEAALAPALPSFGQSADEIAARIRRLSALAASRSLGTGALDASRPDPARAVGSSTPNAASEQRFKMQLKELGSALTGFHSERDTEPTRTKARSAAPVGIHSTEAPGMSSAAKSELVSIWQFLDTIVRPEREISSLLQHVAFPDVRLFIHHTMDMGPTYAQEPGADGDCGVFYRFETEQLPRARRLDEAAEGRLLHFVAWNPFRSKGAPMTPDSESLRLIKSAIAQGAWGVKFYPSMGFSAIDNRFPSPPRARSAREQWRHRYEGWNPADLDAVNLSLFRWCATQGIPVFAHCNTGEFQARDGYYAFADPNFWKSLFERHPELRELRLCLGHAGGENFWSQKPADNARQRTALAWGKVVYELCTRYPNVYCEVGIHDALARDTTGATAANFAAHLRQLCEESLGAPHRFEDKIMYGSDWFMPVDVTPAAYLESFRRALLALDRLDLYKKFFARNALRWLDIADRLDTHPHLDAAARQNLRALLADAERD